MGSFQRGEKNEEEEEETKEQKHVYENQSARSPDNGSAGMKFFLRDSVYPTLSRMLVMCLLVSKNPMVDVGSMEPA